MHINHFLFNFLLGITGDPTVQHIVIENKQGGLSTTIWTAIISGIFAVIGGVVITLVKLYYRRKKAKATRG